MVAFDPTKPFSLEKEEEANASPVFDPTKPFSTDHQQLQHILLIRAQQTKLVQR